ncbi:MAG: 3-phosphoshikimate 1-carboxyvinyltransferase [Actinomycetia bacterium]|nr:3-phosphoshikimate 1-carboxyvinyltransferase [Actinomycetes bacterium]
MSTRRIEPLASPPDATVVVPGSKSITNRALVCTLLADGRSVLDGFLFSDDTEAMLGVVEALGAGIEADRAAARVIIDGVGDELAPGPLDLQARLSGTTSRFAAPLAARGRGPYRIDAAVPMRARPMEATVDALRMLGVEVEGDHLPLTIGGGLSGGTVRLPGDASSQFVSGLLLSGPGLDEGLRVELTTPAVSRPYLDLTVAVMESFGAKVDTADHQWWDIPPGQAYQARGYRIEPDASAASYFFAAAALTGGRVRVEGVGAAPLQGDWAFADVLATMGAEVERGAHYIEVRGTGVLEGIELNMADISDTAQTLAAVAPFAAGPTRVTGVGFIRRKETDRIGAVVTELRRMGIEADEEADGFVISPGRPRPARIETYDDHRMAMSFALVGLRQPGIEIANPDCVAKTFPEFFDVLAGL